jgi:hypothetical protein
MGSVSLDAVNLDQKYLIWTHTDFYLLVIKQYSMGTTYVAFHLLDIMSGRDCEYTGESAEVLCKHCAISHKEIKHLQIGASERSLEWTVHGNRRMTVLH